MVECFFKKEHGRHVGTCNVECLNAAVYKSFVHQSKEIDGKYGLFTPHPKSLGSFNKPSPEELIKLGFGDIHSTISGARIAMENAPQKNNGVSMQQFCKEMESMKLEIVAETKQHVDIAQENTERKFTRRMYKLKASIIATI